MTDYEFVAPLVNGNAHIREAGSLISLCGRSPYWVPASRTEKLCRHCIDIHSERIKLEEGLE